MTSLNLNQRYCVVGTGLTGMATVRYLMSMGCIVELLDTRSNPAQRNVIEQEFDSIALSFGELNTFDFMASDILVLSPGIAMTESFVLRAQSIGVTVTSDVEIFLAECSKPVVAITGSNGKSTVVSLLTYILNEMNISALAAGNIGLPVLQAIGQDPEIFVLELSSFQLERLNTCQVDVACVLNVSEDHMDRYDSMLNYNAAKSKIYCGAKAAVFNADDELTRLGLAQPSISFGSSLNAADFNHQYIENEILICQNNTPFFDVKEMKLKGLHNVDNTLACLAILDQLDRLKIFTINVAKSYSAIKKFPGLEHRCQFVAAFEGVDFINDSKATNVGACLAAIKGLKYSYQKIIVLLGGVAKGADFSELSVYISNHNVTAIVYGQDGDKLAQAFQLCKTPYQQVETMQEATHLAFDIAEQGSVILLSPACASFDAFESFNMRGQAFVKEINSLGKKGEAIND